MPTHLLLVDDEPAIRAISKLELERLGFQVTLASHGREAIQVLDEMHVDVVIVDLLMPGADGIDLTRAIKESRPDLPVIVLTGVGFDDETMKEAFKEGADGYVSKGLTMSHLAMEVRRILSRQNSTEMTVPA
jgi:DNA-binding response OmpR family regulator